MIVFFYIQNGVEKKYNEETQWNMCLSFPLIIQFHGALSGNFCLLVRLGAIFQGGRLQSIMIEMKIDKREKWN